MSRALNVNTPLLSENESYPTEKMIQNARRANRVVTTTGMISLGLLSALITHHTLKDKEWAVESIIIADIISFLTAVSGKTAIVLFFNEAPFLEGFKKICRKQLPDYFKLSKKNVIEKVQWVINLLLSVNASLFWSGLVGVSFKKSGDLLKQFDTKATRIIGDQLQQWYIYLPFLLSSFYANIIAWPGAHTSAYQQKKAFLGWFLKRPWQPKPNSREIQLNDVNFYAEDTHRRVLQEVKKVIEGDNQSLVIDRLFGIGIESEKNQDSLDDFHQLTINKIDRLLSLKSNQLRQLYLRNSNATYTPLSRKQKLLKYGLALGIAGTSIYGYRNIVGLSHVVWKNWDAENVSKYFAGYFAYYSNAEVILLTVYPLICNLFDIVMQGITPYVFSRKKLAFIISVVFFVGVFGGLANAEQSYLDGESTVDIVNSDIASFLVDAFSIHMIFKSTFESKIKESPATDSKTVLKQRFLQLQSLGQEACDVDSIDEMHEESLTSMTGAVFEEDDYLMRDDESDTHWRLSCGIL